MPCRSARAGAAAPVLGFVLVLVLAVGAAGPMSAAAAQEDGGVPAGEDDVGGFLYGRDCAWCHGSAGEGSFQGPVLVGTGAASTYYMLVTGRMPIDDPHAEVGRSAPAYDPEQIAAIVAHVAGFGGGGPPVPDVDLEGADVALGGRLYRLHCAACHSSTGIGGALAFDAFAPPVLPSEPRVVAAAMAVGPGAMPAFSPNALTDEEVDAITAYVQYLQDPADPGGLPLRRAGRVDEGAVAWVAGMGGLLLLVAWMGRRA